MLDELLVVVAIGIGDARHRQAILVLVVGQRDAVALLRQAFANDLQPDLMVVALHFAQQCFAPQTALVGLHAGPDDRQRTLTHVGVAAEKILASVGVIPMLGDGQRRRPFIGTDLILHDSPYCLVGLHHQVLPTRPEEFARPSGKRLLRELRRRRGVSIA